jgi:hypothetical protein
LSFIDGLTHADRAIDQLLIKPQDIAEKAAIPLPSA